MRQKRHMYRQYQRPGGSRFGGRQGSRPGANYPRSRAPRQQGQYIDPKRFVNKAAVTETQEAFVPQHAFADFDVAESLKANIAKKGYVSPTPIQDRAIPHVLSGADVLGIADTGTGKTAAFLIPLINKVLNDRTQNVLIMVPTRELATQIEDEYWGFAHFMRMGAVTCVGGANINRQIQTLRRRPNFVIGTPGRLKDLMNQGELDLSKFQTVVLDEADRMLDMGFIQDMRFILSHMPKEKHTLFFTATLSRDIERLVGDFLHNPVQISIKTRDTAASVEQDIVEIGSRQKLDVLHDLLTQPEFEKVIVFGRTKHGVEKLANMLVDRGFKAESIHGNKTQGKRDRALAAFKKGQVNILVATDVAARGIDVSDVTHVINFDQPTTYDDYVHRIGRTGRAGRTGTALTFV
jgi:ATP-dependent RNA helicase RhlE